MEEAENGEEEEGEEGEGEKREGEEEGERMPLEKYCARFPRRTDCKQKHGNQGNDHMTISCSPDDNHDV